MSEKNKKKSKLSDIFVHYTEGRRFIKKCVKPSRKEFLTMLRAHMAGILFLGFMGYLIKLVHIPINNIVVGSSQ